MKIEAVNRAGMKMIGETGFTLLQHTFNNFLVVLKYTFLFVLLFLLASHESANPKLGNTTFEFYSSEFRSVFLKDNNSGSLGYDRSTTELALMTRFYQERQFMPAWTNNFEVNASFSELTELLRHSYQYGLLPSAYNFSLLSSMEKQMKASVTDEQKLKIRVQLEKNATLSAIRFMNHLAAGIREGDTTQAYQHFLINLPLYLDNQLAKNTLREGILALQPKGRQYVRLQRAASKFINAAILDTIEYTTDQLAVNQNLVAKRLISRGYLDKSFAYDTTALRAALRNYQKAHSLEVNGVIDKNTLHSLTANVMDEFYKIALNLDRLRKDKLKNENYILVNIPEFQLHYYDNRGHSKDFNVIVGKENTPTPLLTSQIEWIIANPYWTVPQSITRNEIIPLIKKDSMYLEKHGFSVVDDDLNTVDASSIDWNTMNPNEFSYWFRQTNNNNALGIIKFLFPNLHSVYLHDTQTKKLFDKRIRAFSHGCIRLQNPEELAQIIISNYCMSAENIDILSVIRKKGHKEIKVKNPLPIYIRYYSCMADSAGNLFFYPDIYNMDDAAISELFGKSTWE